MQRDDVYSTVTKLNHHRSYLRRCRPQPAPPSPACSLSYLTSLFCCGQCRKTCSLKNQPSASIKCGVVE